MTRDVIIGGWSTVCSGTGITDFAESYIRKKGQLKQHSRIGDRMRMVYLHEQALQTKPLEYCS